MVTVNVGALAGTKLYIGAADVTPSPDQYTEVKEISSLGSYGGVNFNKIAVESIGSGFTRQVKGTQLAPSLDLTLNRDDDDPGQILLLAASANRVSLFPFKIVENDGPPTNNTATTIFFTGRVYGYTTSAGGVNDLKRVQTSIEVEPDTIVKVLAT